MSIRPSSLPFLAACPCWQPLNAHGEVDKNDGKLRHEYLAALLRKYSYGQTRIQDMLEYLMQIDTTIKSARAMLSDDDAEAVEWAAEYVKVNSPVSGARLEIEKHCNPLDADFNPIFPNGGTYDMACGNQLFDFKWRERDYRPQFAAYVIARCQDVGCAEVKCHAIYGCSRRVSTFTLSEAYAMEIVKAIIQRTKAPDRRPAPCDYCSWCSQCYRCPPFIESAKSVAAGYSDGADLVKNWHPSQMDSGEELSVALGIWRDLLKKWGESLDYHALEYIKLHGADSVPGWTTGVKAGRSYITDATRAYSLCGLPQDDFLRACQPRLETSKKYPDQVGLVQLFKAFAKIEKTAPAKRELLKKLESVIKKTNDSVILKRAKDETEHDDE